MAPEDLAASTIRQYERITQQLLDQFVSQTSHNDFIGRQLEFPEWFLSPKRGWSPSTVKQYRTALRYILSKNDKVLDSFFDKLNQPIPEREEQPPRTQAQRLKKFPESHLTAIIRELKSRLKTQSQTHWHQPLIHLLHASLLTGLRPFEWNQAKLNQNGPEPEAYLKVKNAKNSKHRSHGEYRTLILNTATDEQLSHLKRWLFEAQGDDKSMKGIYSSIRKLFYRVVTDLWPDRNKHVTLKSARHQFVADAKQAGLPLEEIAALLGHATDVTASESYGRRRHGSGRFPVRAREEEIKRIKIRYNARRTSLEEQLSPNPE